MHSNSYAGPVTTTTDPLVSGGTDDERTYGIAEVSTITGLTPDTLRWYEREGMVPPIPRGGDRRRRYTDRYIGVITLLVRLRETGLPVADMRRFALLVEGGPDTHPERLAILLAHRARIAERRRLIDETSDALELKIGHYRTLIDTGGECAAARPD
ncbi:hypothetical protein GCM10009619_34420 [Williamsia maris]|uniref:DNA-binding transcriptional regulator, MerR family n=1 Tax=Williamsia maris TaxID=72806 RepID=A0ABT1HFW6_9NOCA|nr:DNA-binding transcriptional regulator, MerR family [Williamsia maris]